MKTKKLPQKILSFMLCMVMMLPMFLSGLASITFAAECTHVHTEACLSCEKAEHTHTVECYETQLVCEQEEHTHIEACYQSVLSCSVDAHIHTEECYDENGNLSCEAADHTHSEECFTKELICDKAEHTHADACCVKTLICTQEEHTHTESCYQNCQHICDGDCVAVVETKDKARGNKRNGTLGGTASKLDGDWAYLEKFEVLDDPETTDVVEGILDGAGPFDTSDDPNSMLYKNRQGNDENDQNGKVRSFDTITYKLNYATATSGEYDYVKEGWMNYEMVLPYPATSAIWQTDSMTWVGTKVADQAGLDGIEERTSGYYLSTEIRDGVSCQVVHGKYWLAPNETNPYAIPGEGTLSAVVQVLAMEEGDTVVPRFSAWMEHNDTTGSCTTHGRPEVKSFIAPTTDITAEVRLDIEVRTEIPNVGINSVNFNTGDPDAPNYGIGTLTGKVEACRIGVFLWNGTLDGKGRKGLMAPKSGDTMTFDLTLDASVVPTGGEEINVKDTAYAPLVWALGSNDVEMDWRGRTTITNSDLNANGVANTELTGRVAHMRGDDACYNGGNWSYIIDPSDPKLVHVTITDMEIDLTNFPHWNMNHSWNFDTSGAIPISAGQLQYVQPVIKADGTHIMEDDSITGSAMGSGTVWTSVKDNNMNYTYINKTDDLSYTLVNEDQTLLTDDDAVLSFYLEKGSGTNTAYIMWTNEPTGSPVKWALDPGSEVRDTTGGGYYLNVGGDPSMHDQNIGVMFGLSRYNEVSGDPIGTMVAAKSLVKFDSSAVEPTGVISLMNETNNAYSYKPLYATKADGSPWASDDEMEQTSMTALRYYESIADIPNGAACVGVMIEYLPKDDTYTSINPSVQWMCSDVGLKVKSTAVEGELYQCVVENMRWNRADYEAANKNIPSFSDTVDVPTYTFHNQDEYKKGALNPKNGHLEGDTGGYHYGDVMQIVAARSIIRKEVAQFENGINKSIYYMDSDQRFVDYKIYVATEFITNGIVSLPEGVTSTLTIVDAMPDTIKYVPNSVYYGGTYTQNPIPGRQGTVTGGTQLQVIETWRESNHTWYKFEIPNVVVGEPLEPIYITAIIGTRGVEATDVIDGQHITNKVYSQLGDEITIIQDNMGRNKGLAEIVISKNSATSRSKLADKTYIEKDNAFEWVINVGNNGGSTMPNTIALDVLPYNGDGQGTVFNGTMSLTRWNIDVSVISNFSAANWKIMYTTDTDVRGTKSSEYTTTVQNMKNGVACGPNNVVFHDITTLPGASVNWTTGVVTLPPGFSPTAMVMVGSLPGNTTLKVNVQLSINGAKQGDILVNQLDGYPVPVYTVKRSIEGCTWIDANFDGVRQDSELMLPGVTATLYKLKAGGTATNEADYEVVMDENNTVVSVETDKQKDAITGIQTDYTAGRYQFTNLPAGTYAVKFTNGTTTVISPYTGTEVNIGLDDARDSDAAPTYNETSGMLEKTVILGIVMDAANDAMRDVNQVSRNNDSGFYSTPRSLTISKTVTGNMADRELLFDFTVTLKDASSNNISGTFTCVGGILEDSGATAPTATEITFTDGTATVQLMHGQTLTIQGLPNHCRYTVAETAVAGYIKTVTGNESNTNMQADTTVAYSNRANIITPTGILLEIWPYILIVLLAAGGAVVYLSVRRKRKRSDGRYGKSNPW